MELKQVKMSFSGSFQCRLATDPDPPTARRSDPNRSPTGWTHDYGEAEFDRIIRCQSPIELRSALIDSFEPVKVTSIDVQLRAPVGNVEMPFQRLPADPLLGAAVSLGETAFFDSTAGGGPGSEAIENCQLSFGTLLTATPASKPRLAAIVRDSSSTAGYFVRKAGAIASAVATGNIVPPRLAVLAAPGLIPLSPPRNIETYANFYGMTEDIVPVAATIDFATAGATGIRASLMLGWTFMINLTFSHFDGDTLTGRVAGNLAGVHSLL
jgi:hypothetical protein